jgi:hypothetical protein
LQVPVTSSPAIKSSTRKFPNHPTHQTWRPLTAIGALESQNCIHAVLQKLGVSNTSQYTYRSLGRRKDKRIHILLLKPGPWDSPIECELHTTKIDHAGTYEALSYVWGSPNPSAEILLHGRKHTVTPNLESALRHLRFDDRPRRLWVGALCINQAGVEERSVQVRMIADIYARAETTVSWLGEADEESDEAMELIRTLGSWLQEHESALDEFLDWPLRPREAAAEVERLGFPLRERNWPAVWRLLERPVSFEEGIKNGRVFC